VGCEESNILGKVSGALNAMFISLIPKRSKPLFFDGLKLVSLCNLLYKVISKILATRVKVVLSTCIFNKQFGSL
jgi:hypothetical protein